MSIVTAVRFLSSDAQVTSVGGAPLPVQQGEAGSVVLLSTVNTGIRGPVGNVHPDMPVMMGAALTARDAAQAAAIDALSSKESATEERIATEAAAAAANQFKIASAGHADSATSHAAVATQKAEDAHTSASSAANSAAAAAQEALDAQGHRSAAQGAREAAEGARDQSIAAKDSAMNSAETSSSQAEVATTKAQESSESADAARTDRLASEAAALAASGHALAANQSAEASENSNASAATHANAASASAEAANLKASQAGESALAADESKIAAAGHANAALAALNEVRTREWLYGVDEPDNGGGSSGDRYLRSNGQVWAKVGASWVYTGINLKLSAADLIDDVSESAERAWSAARTLQMMQAHTEAQDPHGQYAKAVDLGTAAGFDAAASLTDLQWDRLMRTGQYGLGPLPLLLPDETNLNGITNSVAFYRVWSPTNGPIAWGWVHLLVFPTSGDAVVQVATTSFGPVEPGRQFIRSLTTDGWSPWRRVLFEGDIKTINGLSVVGSGDVAIQGMPVGTVIWSAKPTAPAGFLKANGAQISRSAYSALFEEIGTTFGEGDGSTTFHLPELRGQFLRGWDDGRGIDTNRVFGSHQQSEFMSHTHSGTANSAGAHTHTLSPVGDGGGNQGSIDGASGGSGSRTTSSAGAHTHTLNINAAGGNETRPRNVALLPCIKY